MKLLFTNEWLRKRIESDPDDVEALAGPDFDGPPVDELFYCSRCSEPVNRNPDGSDRAKGGMCAHCASTGHVIG